MLVLGYGNPGRGDDALGPRIAGRVERLATRLAVRDCVVDEAMQLNIEDAARFSEYRLVILVDAAANGAAPFVVSRIRARTTLSYTSHSVEPETVVALADDAFGPAPPTFLVAVRGERFELGEQPTNGALANERAALEYLGQVLAACNTYSTEDLMSDPKTILIIDDDPDIRSSLRLVLEAGGFSVGEASGGEDGLKVVERIEPDAVIVDLMMETIDAGHRLASRLKEAGFGGPVYLLSSAGDTVRYNMHAQSLGFAGIFQKPVDHASLITTLKTKLGVPA